MKRVGEVWESRVDGLYVVLEVEDYKGQSMVTLLCANTNKLGYLPEYVLVASEMVVKQGYDPWDEPIWMRVA